MKSRDADGPEGSGRETRINSPTPDNLQDDTVPDDTGFLIVRFKPNTITGDRTDLGKAVRGTGLLELDKTLNTFNLAGAPLISSVTPGQLRKLEEETANHEFAPAHSLLSYWRIDAREAGEALEEIEAALRLLPEVELVYREKTVSDPSMAGNNPHSGRQKFLDKAQDGVDARWVWTRPSGRGEGMHFIDIEQEWILDHEDLPAPKLICNDNRKGEYGFRGDHGTSVVGIVGGVDNDRGVIGIAPKAKSVRVASHWSKKTKTSNIANAIAVAITTPPLPHVLLIEAQRGDDKLPPETDEAVFNAIGRAVATGVIVVETAGNGNQYLDFWKDANGKHRLDRNSTEFKGKDSGAILVGAATAKVPHERSVWGSGGSNFGSRIDCYAWGDSIVTCGKGTLSGSGPNSYTDTFSGTSGAAAIIAGCALLLQGLHFAKNNSLLSPASMRDLLSDPRTGTAPGGQVAGHIGVMPDLQAIVKSANLSPSIIKRILLKIWRRMRLSGARA